MNANPDFDRDYPDLDPGIREAVRILRAAGVETFESCEGGEGHAYAEPTIRFHGYRQALWRALSAAQDHGLPVGEVRRTWPVIDGEPVGPYGELVLREKLASSPCREVCRQSRPHDAEA